MPLEFAPGLVVRIVAPTVPVIHAALPAASGAVVVPVIGPQGPPGPVSPSGVGQVRLTTVAAVALSGHRAVTRKPDGSVEYASNTVAAHLHAPVWITLGAAASGGSVELLAYGTLDEPSWAWAPGPLYLGAGGLITQATPTAPSALFLAQIGVATGPTSVFIDRRSSINLT